MACKLEVKRHYTHSKQLHYHLSCWEYCFGWMVNTIITMLHQTYDKGFHCFMEFQEQTSGERKHFWRKREPEYKEEIIKRCVWWWIVDFTIGVCFLLSVFPLLYIIFAWLWTCSLFSEHQWEVVVGICLPLVLLMVDLFWFMFMFI